VIGTILRIYYFDSAQNKKIFAYNKEEFYTLFNTNKINKYEYSYCGRDSNLNIVFNPFNNEIKFTFPDHWYFCDPRYHVPSLHGVLNRNNMTINGSISYTQEVSLGVGKHYFVPCFGDFKMVKQ